jgi:hypothetical protein
MIPPWMIEDLERRRRERVRRERPQLRIELPVRPEPAPPPPRPAPSATIVIELGGALPGERSAPEGARFARDAFANSVAEDRTRGAARLHSNRAECERARGGTSRG